MKKNRWVVVCIWVILVAVLAGQAGAAGLPGMEAPAKTGQPDAGSPSQPPAPKTFQEKYLAEGSPYRGAAIGLATLIVLLVTYRFATRRIRHYLADRAYNPENVRKFMRTWKGVWSFFIAVFVLISFSGSLSFLGLSAGFVGMMLGWSLQAPVTGLAAWLMIVAKKPFRIGDRVIIGGTIGDVTDITLTHVVLNQVGGTIGGEEQSGRGILVPNAILFGQIITNYTLDKKFMLDEVPVRVSFDSDFDLAGKILLNAANAVTKEIVAETGEQPFLRSEFYDAGVLLRLRYQTVGTERQRISSDMVDVILREFKAAYPKVKFGLPASFIRYRKDEASDPALPPLEES